MDSKKIIGGLLAGAAIGVAIGLLIAPASGEKTRGKLVRGSRRLADHLRDTVEDSIDSLKDRFNSGVEEVVRKGKEIVNHTSEKIKV
jgi:gas vesicle protein